MSVSRPPSRLVSLLGVLFLIGLFHGAALAQDQGNGGGNGGPPIEEQALGPGGGECPECVPLVLIDRGPQGIVTTSPIDVKVYWCDDASLDSGSRWIKRNGNSITSQLNYTYTSGIPCNTTYRRVSEGSVTLEPGQNTFTARICNVEGNCARELEQVSVVYEDAEPPTVSLLKHNGDNRDRSLCLTAGAGEAAAYQCGDLLVAHAMPAYMTKGRDRSLTLVYNSDQAAPRAVVTADIGMPLGHDPDEIEVKLKIGGSVLASAVYPLATWSGQTHQISMGFVADSFPTGLYPFTLVATAMGSYHIRQTALSDTLIIVNRRDSEFGLGWSPAGIERLVLNQPSGTGEDILWLGGDGSARRYRKAGAADWIAAEGPFRDTITLAGNIYTRHLKHGAKVQFWNQGLHIRTISRTQDTTKIKWGGGVIDTIQVPTAGATTRNFYTLHYSGSPARLDSIVDPTGRALAASINGSGLLTGLTDPDGHDVTFSYNAAGQMRRRYNRRGIGTRFSYDGTWGVTDAEVPLDVTAGDTAHIRYLNANESWLAIGLDATPRPRQTTVASKVFGPRPIADDAWFWIDRWGAPVKVKDALGNYTYITRADPDAPALPSRIEYPDGRVVRLDWSGRANLRVQNDSTVGATTRWTYNFNGAKADSPDSLVSPDGEVTRFTYTTAGLTDRVTAPNGHVTDFDYGSGNQRGLVTSVTEESVATFNSSTWDDYTTDPDLVTTFTYDDWGNVKTQTSPLSNTTTYRRDNKNRVIRVVDAVGDSTGRTYDALNRVTFTKVYTSSGTITTTRDWGIDFLEEVIDPRGVTRGFEYDDAGRLVREIDEQDEADEFGYDEAGNRIWAFTRLLQAQNDTIYFKYDKAGLLTKKHWPARTATIPECTLDAEDYLENYFGCLTTGTPADSITYAYDAMGRMEEARTYESDPAYTLTRTYRDDGLILSEVRDDGTRTATNRYDHSPGGKRTLHVIGGGPQTWEAPDSIFHVYHPTSGELDRTVVEWGYGSTRRDSVRFFWDELGRRKRLLYSSQSGTSAPIDVTFNYDKDGRLRRVCSTHGGSVAGSEDAFKIREAYSYNDDGTMRQRYRVSGSVQGDTECTANSTESAHGYVYDQRKQLVADTATGGLFEYDFDYSGNMIEKRSIFGGGGSDTLRATFTIPVQSNRIAEYNPNAESSVHYNHYYYDNGTRRAEWWTAPTGSAIGSRLYSLDGLGRMAAMTFLNACDNPLTSQGLSCVFNTVQPEEPVCSYDPLGRLVHLCGNGGPIPTFDGDNVVRSGTDDAEFAWSFVHSPGVENPIMGHRQAQIEITHDYIYFVTDGNGRHLAAGDATGLDYTNPNNTTEFNLYMAGAVAAGGIHNSFGFSATRQPSAELAGVSFFRNRWLDTRTGRWTQEDPIGLAGGVNLYQYAGNNPATYTDPFGLCPPEDENYDDCAPTSPHYWANREAQDEGSSVVNNVAGVAATVAGNLAENQCPDCLTGTPPAVGPSGLSGAKGLLGRLTGKPYPTKVGAGGRLQPYNPANGRYLGADANPGLANSPGAHFGVGVGQGIAKGVDPAAPIPIPVTRAQGVGQTVGKVIGSILSNLPF